MVTTAPTDARNWNRQSSPPIIDGNFPLSARPSPDPSDYTPSADSRLIYVSDTGNDGTAVVTDIAAQTDAFDPQGTVLPYLTLSAAYAQTREGFPDWVLFKRGDSWTSQSFILTKSGRSITERALITYYGTSGDRPVFQTGTSRGLTAFSTHDNYVLHGLDFYAHTRDPNSPDYVAGTAGNSGVLMIGGGANVTIDDCIARFYIGNVIIQSFGGLTYSNLTIRRSIILDSYRYIGSHNQGMYLEAINGILVEDNVFDHNGWNEDDILGEPTLFNHNLYMQFNSFGDIIVRNNIFTRASSHGIQARSGGEISDNLFIQNSISLLLGSNQNAGFTPLIGQAFDNVILDGKLMDPDDIYTTVTTAVTGLDVDSSVTIEADEVSFTNNIVANVRDTEGATLTGIRDVTNVDYTDNVVFDWNPSEDMTDVSWTHPEAGIEEYMTFIGETPTFDAFLTEIRGRDVLDWPTNFEASTVNDYFRAGFDR